MTNEENIYALLEYDFFLSKRKKEKKLLLFMCERIYLIWKKKKKKKNRNGGESTVMYLCLLGNFARLHLRFMARFRFHFALRFVYLLASRICAQADVMSRFVLLRCYHPDLSIVLLRRDGGIEMITRCEIQTFPHKLTLDSNSWIP